jgi:hypothetical protein
MIDAALILHIVAGVIDRRDDEASIGKSCRGCVVGTEPTTATVRDHDEWQFIGHKKTVPCPLNDLFLTVASSWGARHGYHIAPISGLPSVSAGTSKN